LFCRAKPYLSKILINLRADGRAEFKGALDRSTADRDEGIAVSLLIVVSGPKRPTVTKVRFRFSLLRSSTSPEDILWQAIKTECIDRCHVRDWLEAIGQTKMQMPNGVAVDLVEEEALAARG
jgi:hypothetical protein